MATWCGQLRDLLSAEHGVMGTVQATVATCPAAWRGDVSGLATRLARQDPARAVHRFAAAADDPSGDLVASVMLLAMSRSGRTAEVLSELAVTIRDRASMRLRVDAERAGQRGEARFVVGFGAVVITAVIVFGQNTTFLDAYDSAAGQLVVGRRRPAAAYPAPAPAAEVTIVGLAYQPATVEVPAGATVHFTNTRTSARTVTAGTPTAVGEAFAEVLNGDGSTVDVVIEQPGEQRYFCQVHPLHARGDRRGLSAAVLAQRSG